MTLTEPIIPETADSGIVVCRAPEVKQHGKFACAWITFGLLVLLIAIDGMIRLVRLVGRVFPGVTETSIDRLRCRAKQLSYQVDHCQTGSPGGEAI